MGTGSVATCDSCGMEHSKERMQEKVQEIKGTVEVSNIAGVESLMTRGHLALEDAKWNEADEYFDKVLDIDPKHACAYIGKLCADLELQEEGLLAQNEKPLTGYKHYQKALRFADAGYRATLEGYNNRIVDRIQECRLLRKKEEAERKEKGKQRQEVENEKRRQDTEYEKRREEE